MLDYAKGLLNLAGLLGEKTKADQGQFCCGGVTGSSFARKGLLEQFYCEGLKFVLPVRISYFLKF